MTRRAARPSLSNRLYARLLTCYPLRFRTRFEAGMRDAFAREHAEARARGTVALIALWLATGTQAIVLGLAERRRDRRLSRISTSGGSMPRRFLIDWRDAIRSLRASPIVTLVAVLSLALGIGATTALFSILDSLVLKSLPVRDPSRLVVLDAGSWTNPIWEQIRARQHELFDAAFAWSTTRFDLSVSGRTDFVNGAYASGGMFDVLGVRALRGRLFTDRDDDRSGGPDGPVAVVSEAFWRARLDGSEAALGRVITLNRVPFTVIGVLPSAFFGPEVGTRDDVVIPIADAAVLNGPGFLDGRATWWLEIMGRLKPDQTPAQAEAALRGVEPQIRRATVPQDWSPKDQQDYLKTDFTLVPAATGESELRSRYRDPLITLLVVVSLVLLIACANIASLLLARATARRREMSVRLALGASAGRLARQLLVESLLIALAGAAAGLAFAAWTSRLLVYEISQTAFLDLAIDGRVLAFTTAVAIVTALVFGVAPMIAATRVAPNEALKEEGRGVTGDRRWGIRNALVVGQVALSLALVVAAGLFIRTFATITTAALGFTPDPLLVVSIDARRANLAPDAQAAAFERTRQAVAALPGVADAVTSYLTPIGGASWNTFVDVPGVSLTKRDRIPWVNLVSPGWFRAYGIRLLAGRPFDDRDRAGAPPVVIVNETFARRFFAAQSPVGRRFRSAVYGSSSATDFTIVGVVSDAVYRSQRAGLEPTIFLPLAQNRDAEPNVNLTIRAAAGPPGALIHSVTDTIGREIPAAALTFDTYATRLRATTMQPRIVAGLSGFFGGLALLLAAIGLYGVTAYSVSQRRTEIGVRMALGARPSAILRLVIGRVVWLVGSGVALGAGLSLWATHFVSTLLFGVAPRDPATFIVAALVLGACGVLAGWLPARRATRLDPVSILRE